MSDYTVVIRGLFGLTTDMDNIIIPICILLKSYLNDHLCTANKQNMVQLFVI